MHFFVAQYISEFCRTGCVLSLKQTARAFLRGTHVCSCAHACVHARGVPSDPQHRGTTSLVTTVADEMGICGGKMDRGGKEWWGVGGRFELRWERQGRGKERRTHATLHGARLLSKPRLLLFPLECRKADSQSGSSSIFVTTTHKLVPKLLLRRWRKRHGERCLVLWFGNTSSPLSCSPFIEGVRMHFNKTVK